MTNCSSDFVHKRSPSPIVEMPLSPPPPDASDVTRLRRGNSCPLKVNTNIEQSVQYRGPFSPTIREIPIEVQQEVNIEGYTVICHF